MMKRVAISVAVVASTAFVMWAAVDAGKRVAIESGTVAGVCLVVGVVVVFAVSIYLGARYSRREKVDEGGKE